VHPLDLSDVQTIVVPLNGKKTNVTFCTNTFQYLTLDPASFNGFDAILGDAFLRNAYASCVFPFSPLLAAFADHSVSLR
jgi:hypothetical protein